MWDLHAREHRRQVRAAIERARAAVLATVRVRGPITGRAARSWLRLEAAEQLFGALIALSEMLAEERDPAIRRVADIMLRRITPVLKLLAQFIVTDAPDRLPRLERAVSLIAAIAATMPDTPLHRIADVIVERLRIVVTLAATESGAIEQPLGGLPQPAAQRVAGPVRANLTAGSEVFRHAARVAAVAVPAFAFTLTWPGTYEHWLTITMLLTMQPYFALTFTRAVERIGGTVLGGVAAAAIALVCTTPLAMAAALFPLAVLALSMRGVSFGLFISCLTPMVVLLSELGRPGESQVTIAVMRALFTLAGGLLAVAGSFLLWPVWEPGRLLAGLRTAIRAHAAYAAAEIAALLGEATPASVEPARRAAGLASNNVEASLQRALLEPHGGDGRVEAALTIDAALRRMAGRLSALQLDAHRQEHDRGAWHAWRDWIATGMEAVESGRRDLPPRPALPRNDPPRRRPRPHRPPDRTLGRPGEPRLVTFARPQGTEAAGLSFSLASAIARHGAFAGASASARRNRAALSGLTFLSTIDCASAACAARVGSKRMPTALRHASAAAAKLPLSSSMLPSSTQQPSRACSECWSSSAMRERSWKISSAASTHATRQVPPEARDGRR